METETNSGPASSHSFFDPFPEPRLYPDQWDLSELLDEARPAKPPPILFSGYEAFPKVRTFPVEWYLE